MIEKTQYETAGKRKTAYNDRNISAL